MQITGVTQHHVRYPLRNFEPTWIPGYAQHSHEAEVFEMETDAGGSADDTAGAPFVHPTLPTTQPPPVRGSQSITSTAA